MILNFQKFIVLTFFFIKKWLSILIGFPIALLLIFISPVVKIQFIKLFSSRIGHYALNTELLLCARDENIFDLDKRIRIFFYSDPNNPICNTQLHLMWKRVIPILPFPYIINQIDKILARLIGSNYSNYPLKKYFEDADGAIDKWSLLSKITHSHISFTKSEEGEAQRLMQELGIPLQAKFICLLGRDAQYLSNYMPVKDWSYHDYRNFEIQSFQKGAKFLAEQGFYVVRIGKDVCEKFNTDHENIIDYANHPLRSDFMDIYLSAKCYFFISPRSGIDAVAQIFRRPLMLVNFPICDYWSLYYLNLFIPKKVFDINKNRYLSYREMCLEQNNGKTYKKFSKKLSFINNSSEEIIAAINEMMLRLDNNWHVNIEDEVLQNKFWQSIPKTEAIDAYKNILRIGASFLKDNPNFLYQN